MKVFPSLLGSFLAGLITGSVVAWPSAQQDGILLFYQRLEFAALFFVAGALWSLVVLKLVSHIWVAGDGVRCLGFLVGAALCFSLVRQEITLLVYASLWTLPGTFLGTSVAKSWLRRLTSSVVLEPSL